MNGLSSNSLLMMKQSMRFLWTKQTTILDNLSNIETPGYKTKYVTFEEALRERLQKAARTPKPIASVRGALGQAQAAVHVAEAESTRMDGNGVNATEQGIELSRTGYQLQFVLGAIGSDLELLRTAIRGQ